MAVRAVVADHIVFARKRHACADDFALLSYRGVKRPGDVPLTLNYGYFLLKRPNEEHAPIRFQVKVILAYSHYVPPGPSYFYNFSTGVALTQSDRLTGQPDLS